jgi:hypothetical protein
MARSPIRITIPRNTGELLKLADLIYARHKQDGDSSPLKSMEDYNWSETSDKLKQAKELQDQVEALRKQAEGLQAQIDALAIDVKGSVTGSRDVLLGVYKKNPKKLGDWGYEVDDSPKAKKEPKA